MTYSARALNLAKCFAVVAFLVVTSGWYSHRAPVVTVPPMAQWADSTVCDAWHRDKADPLDAEVQRRGLLTRDELVTARAGRATVGMSYMAVHCALGIENDYSSVTTAHGLTSTLVYRREGAHPLIVRLDNGRVEAIAD